MCDSVGETGGSYGRGGEAADAAFWLRVWRSACAALAVFPLLPPCAPPAPAVALAGALALALLSLAGLGLRERPEGARSLANLGLGAGARHAELGQRRLRAELGLHSSHSSSRRCSRSPELFRRRNRCPSPLRRQRRWRWVWDGRTLRPTDWLQILLILTAAVLAAAADAACAIRKQGATATEAAWAAAAAAEAAAGVLLTAGTVDGVDPSAVETAHAAAGLGAPAPVAAADWRGGAAADSAWEGWLPPAFTPPFGDGDTLRRLLAAATAAPPALTQGLW